MAENYWQCKAQTHLASGKLGFAFYRVHSAQFKLQASLTRSHSYRRTARKIMR
jgi:hypothetical protein